MELSDIVIYFKDQDGTRISIDDFFGQYQSIDVDTFYFFDGGLVLLRDGKILYEANDLYDHFVGVHFLLHLWYYCNQLDRSPDNRSETDLLIKPGNDLDVPNGICQLREMKGTYLSFEENGGLVDFRYAGEDVLVALDKNSLIEPIRSVLDSYMELVRAIFSEREEFSDSNLSRFCFLWEKIR